MRVRDGNRAQIRQTGESTITLSGVLRLCALWGADALLVTISKVDTRGGALTSGQQTIASRKSGRQVTSNENIPVSSCHAGNETRPQIFSQDPPSFPPTVEGKKKTRFIFYFGPVETIRGTDLISTIPLELYLIQSISFKNQR